MQAEQTECNRCGACCREGGPALHGADLELITSGSLTFESLITIRKGELVINPDAGGLKASQVELVKIKGKKGSWTCKYYDDASKGCTRYEQRPIACATLKCWDTADILAMMEKDVLSRMDILNPTSRAAKLVANFEDQCAHFDYESLAEQKDHFSEELKSELGDAIKKDLVFRDKVAKEEKLSLDDELFLFGRPLFQLLQPFGAKVFDSPMGIEVAWK